MSSPASGALRAAGRVPCALNSSTSAGNRAPLSALPRPTLHSHSGLKRAISSPSSRGGKSSGHSVVGGPTGPASRARGPAPSAALADPWGVSADQWESIEANLFAVSLFPYLAFLWFLGAKETKTPAGANFGFRFLLAFVFGTIPAGIYAKVHYNDILANVDWLHGGAESLLTITNLIIVLGMRSALADAGAPPGGDGPGDGAKKGQPAGTAVTTGAALVGLGATALLATLPQAADATNDVATLAGALLPGARHLEPGNALSVPTWAIHVSSLVEWLVAMGFIWQWADVSGNPRWKGLTWGMLPSHTSGICACTYHLFYNAPVLNGLVALQAFLTVVGNSTCALAAWRIYSYECERSASEAAEQLPAKAAAPSSFGSSGMAGFEDLADAWGADSTAAFVGKLTLLSLGGAALVKYGSLYVDAPFEPTMTLALAIVFGPSLLNVAKWAKRSAVPETDAA